MIQPLLWQLCHLLLLQSEGDGPTDHPLTDTPPAMQGIPTGNAIYSHRAWICLEIMKMPWKVTVSPRVGSSVAGEVKCHIFHLALSHQCGDLQVARV